MGSAIEPVSSASDLGPSAARPTPGDAGPPAAVRPAPTPPAAVAADLRLIIEPNANGQGYIYKTLDRRTGEVVQQFPRDQVVRMRDEARYRAGLVIDSRA